MSTRRARIKAVTALPPRRKNVDVNESKKQSQPKDADKVQRSPKSPRVNTGKTIEGSTQNSPQTKKFPPDLIPINTNVITASPARSRTPKSRTPVAEAVPVITSPPSQNVFASPRPWESPDRRRIPSPAIPSPKIQNEASKSKSDPQEVGASTTEPQKAEEKATSDTNNTVVDEEIMDGIVPLHVEGTMNENFPKLSDLYKEDGISENAEIVFDPIVPLPSPSKVRPKLRPVPRLAPYRRNSIQGSASESEDETRRALLGNRSATPAPNARQRHDSHTSHSTLLSAQNRDINRNRNDSVCSSLGQPTTVVPPPATSPTKEKAPSKSIKRQEMGKRMWRRRRETVKKDALTMYDLIFYNPTSNPIVPDQDEMKAKEENAKDEADRKAKAQESEEDADDPPTDATPVPQIKLGPNGEIMLDEESLVIKQTGSKRKLSSVVREGAWASSGGGKYNRAPRTAEWSQAETVRFYRALAAIGTDFSLMAPLFPDRSRKDLKTKFKKEERLNGAQVDKALRLATTWDAQRLQEEFVEERAEAVRMAEAERRRLLEEKRADRERVRRARELRQRHSKSAIALETAPTLFNLKSNEMTADDFVQRGIDERLQARRNRKRKDNSEPVILESSPASQFATLTLIGSNIQTVPQRTPSRTDLASIQRVEPKQVRIEPKVAIGRTTNPISSVPSNIETGSLVVLRVNDPASPSKTMLQTYIADGTGKLTPVALPSTFLNSVVGYMKKTTNSISASPSPLTSPTGITQDRICNTPSVIKLNPSPVKRQRHSSFTITQL